MDKRTLILDTMQELFIEGKAGTASVSDIAKQALQKAGSIIILNQKKKLWMRSWKEFTKTLLKTVPTF